MFRGLRKILGICTLKDYLSKDKNGVTYLERLLKKGKRLDVFQEDRIKNSVEAGYIYTKYNRKLYLFEYTEEQLFANINGEYFIEYLLSKNNFSTSMIEEIKNHIEFIDILIKYDKYKLIYINKELVNKLLLKDDNNNYLIEKYINDETVIKYLIDKCDDGNILLEIFDNHNIDINILKYCNEQTLMSKINNNETLLDYLLNKNIIPDKLNNIPNNNDYIKFLIDKNILDYFKNVKEEVLLNVINNKTVLEILLENNKLDKINFCINLKQTINILDKLNRLDLIEKVSIELLAQKSKKVIVKKSNKKTVLEYLLDKGYKTKFSISTFTKEKDKNLIISILYKYKEFELIAKSIDNDSLFYSLDNKELLIDKLIQENVNIFIIDNIKLKILLRNYKDNKTYLDYILEMIKEKKIKYNLTKISFYESDINDIVMFYISLAKHDMIKYIKDLTEDDLLKKYDGKTLLEELLNKDKDITLNKILTEKVKSKVKIATILKSKGIIVDDVDIPLKDSNVTNDYLRKQQMRYGIGPLYKKGDYLLNKLQDLFLNDGKSDKDLVMSLVCGYRQALITNYDLFIKELELLIKIKENYPKMYYIKSTEGTWFRRITGSIHSEYLIVYDVLHETGHALHSYICNSKFPNDLEEILLRVRNDKDIIKKIEKLSKEYELKKEKICQLVKKEYDNCFSNFNTNEK